MNIDGRYKQESADIYEGFNPFTKVILKHWEKRVISYASNEYFQDVILRINSDLNKNNIVLFFDHHYAFDALPLGIAIGNHLNPRVNVIIPYAIHLDMGLGREGEPSFRYWIRTFAFQWFVKRIKISNPQIKFYPVAREFELETPRLKKVVDNHYEGINTTYIRTFIRNFSDYPKGQVCFLTPFSGIGFPDKPVLHPQVFRSIKIVLAKSNNKVTFYITGAYPEWIKYQNYLAPLFMNHRIFIRGPFNLPTNEYEESGRVIESELDRLRGTANFISPDYDKLLTK